MSRRFHWDDYSRYKVSPANPEVLRHTDVCRCLRELRAKRPETVDLCVAGQSVEAYLDNSDDRTSGYSVLSDEESESLRSRAPGVARGRLVGGNLSLIAALMGTPYEMEMAGRILLIEEVGEPPYRIDRFLSQLRLAGKLDRLAGLLLGQLTGCDAEDGVATLSLDDLWLDYFDQLGVPALSGFPTGHARTNVTLPLGARIELDADHRHVTVLENPVTPEEKGEPPLCSIRGMARGGYSGNLQSLEKNVEWNESDHHRATSDRRRRMKKLATLMVSGVLGLVCHAAAAATLYVAADGNDANPGTADRPFATLQRARNEIRQRKAGGLLPGVRITVELRGGIYELAQPLELTAQDSGTQAVPIVYRARQGETAKLVGGRTVTGWKPVAEAAVLTRLDEAARGQVWQADLRAQNITDLKGIGEARTYQSDPGLEVFFQDKPMTLARYPNAGYMTIASALDANGNPGTGIVTTAEGKFICKDSRPTRWVGEKDIWLHGFWVHDWSDLRVPLCSMDPAARAISLGPRPGQSYRMRSGQWFYAENVLPELDRPGEWYLDRDTAVLYFWPPAPLSAGKVVVSVVRDLVRLDDVSHVTFRGLLFEAGRGSALVVKGGAHVRVEACTIRNMGNWAVKVHGGTAHGVVGCDIYQTGQGGAHLEGGNRKTLTPAGHYADNNHIHHTARWDPVYQQAITLFGVGNRATHNLIDNVPHIAIGFTGNDQTIEYNEIHSAVFQSNDAGAIYTSPPDETWSMRGHKIRYNYLHDIHGFQGKGCHGVYLDDCFSSADISSNIFYDVATAILIGGGRDNLMTNNMFINCGRAFSIDARGLGWAKGVGTFATKELIELNYKQPPWSIRYPELLGVLEDEPLAPKGNVMARNICWGGPWGRTQAEALPLVKFENNLVDVDPRFAGKPPADFRLADDSPAAKLGFQPIPLDKIGVYQSEDRASWPVVHSVRP